MWKDLSMVARLVYTGMFTLVFAGAATTSINVGGSLIMTMAVMVLIASFVNEFVVVRYLVNQVTVLRNKWFVLLGFLFTGAATACIMAYFIWTFTWSEPFDESALSFRYLLAGYLWGGGMFIAAATTRRTLEQHLRK